MFYWVTTNLNETSNCIVGGSLRAWSQVPACLWLLSCCQGIMIIMIIMIKVMMPWPWLCLTLQ
jgi:hypothetical protein